LAAPALYEAVSEGVETTIGIVWRVSRDLHSGAAVIERKVLSVALNAVFGLMLGLCFLCFPQWLLEWMLSPCIFLVSSHEH
jgi:hypothetical protein